MTMISFSTTSAIRKVKYHARRLRNFVIILQEIWKSAQHHFSFYCRMTCMKQVEKRIFVISIRPHGFQASCINFQSPTVILLSPKIYKFPITYSSIYTFTVFTPRSARELFKYLMLLCKRFFKGKRCSHFSFFSSSSKACLSKFYSQNLSVRCISNSELNYMNLAKQ